MVINADGQLTSREPERVNRTVLERPQRRAEGAPAWHEAYPPPPRSCPQSSLRIRRTIDVYPPERTPHAAARENRCLYQRHLPLKQPECRHDVFESCFEGRQPRRRFFG